MIDLPASATGAAFCPKHTLTQPWCEPPSSPAKDCENILLLSPLWSIVCREATGALSELKLYHAVSPMHCQGSKVL